MIAVNKHYTTTRAYPTLPTKPQPSEQDAAYRAALELVARIDEDLTRGTGHYRTKAGVLLVKLDQVVGAILSGELAGSE